MEKSENTIALRLIAIADVLETASKQARLLAAEIDSPLVIKLNQDALVEAAVKAIDDKAKADRASLSMKPT